MARSVFGVPVVGLSACQVVRVAGLPVLPVPVLHGEDYVAMGFVFGPPDARFIYLSDVSRIPDVTDAVLRSRGPIPSPVPLPDAPPPPPLPPLAAQTEAGDSIGGRSPLVSSTSGSSINGCSGGCGSSGIDLLVVDLLFRDGTFPTHFNMPQSLDAVRRLRPRRALFIGMSDRLEHDAVNAELARLRESEGLDVQLAHDGLRVPLRL